MNEIEKINKSILTINPNAQFTFKDNDINSITWLNGTIPISKADIEAMIPTVETEIANAKANAIAWLNDTPVISQADIVSKQTELRTIYDNKKYQRDRAEEYPDIRDQLDDIFHNGIEGWKTSIQVIKTKYPKETI